MTRALKILHGPFGRAALLESDCDLALHAHPDCHALIKVDGANAWMRAGERLYPMGDDNVVLMDAWQPHQNQWQSGWGAPRPAGVNTLVLALFIRPQWLAKRHPGGAVAGLRGFFPEGSVRRSATVRGLVHTCLDHMVGSCGMSPGDGSAAVLKVEELALTLVEEASAWQQGHELRRRALAGISDSRVRRAVAVLHETLGVESDMERIAARVGLSRAHFFRLFRDQLHVAPGTYLSTLKFEEALRRLEETSPNMSKVSADLGFAEPQNFTRFFRQCCGVSPTSYLSRLERAPAFS